MLLAAEVMQQRTQKTNHKISWMVLETWNTNLTPPYSTRGLGRNSRKNGTGDSLRENVPRVRGYARVASLIAMKLYNFWMLGGLSSLRSSYLPTLDQRQAAFRGR